MRLASLEMRLHWYCIKRRDPRILTLNCMPADACNAQQAFVAVVHGHKRSIHSVHCYCGPTLHVKRVTWCLHYLRACWHLQVDNGTQSETAALYNLSSNTYTPFHITEEAEAAGHILLPDGRGLIVGGLPTLPVCPPKGPDCLSVTV